MLKKQFSFKNIFYYPSFVVFLLLSVVFLQGSVFAQEQTFTLEWIDRGHIKVNDTIYIDTDIYDDTHQYRPANSSCEMIDMEDDLQSKIVIDIPTGTATGCTARSVTTINKPENRDINAYKVADNAVLLVTGTTCSLSSTTGYDAFSGSYYRQLPSTNPEYASIPEDERDDFLRMGNDAPAEGDNNNRVTQNGSSGAVVINGCSAHLGGWKADLTFANGGNKVDTLPSWAPPLPAGVILPDDVAPPDGTGETEPESTCEANNPGGFSWLFCGVIEAVDDAIGGIIEQAYDLLSVRSDLYSNPQLQQSWAYFRNIASAMLVVIGLVMIIGQAIGRD